MSIDFSRIVANQATLDYLSNAICCNSCFKKNLDNQLYQCKLKKGIYCKECAHMVNCLECPLKVIEHSPQYTALLNTIKIKCINFSNGCLTLFDYNSIVQHEIFCPFNKIQNQYAPQKSTKENLFKALHKTAEPFIPKVSPSNPNYNESQESQENDLNEKINQLSSKIEALEANQYRQDSLIMKMQQELGLKFEKMQKSLDESFKSFCESILLTRICNR